MTFDVRKPERIGDDPGQQGGCNWAGDFKTPRWQVIGQDGCGCNFLPFDQIQNPKALIGNVMVDIDIRFRKILERLAQAFEIGTIYGNECVEILIRFFPNPVATLQITEARWNPVREHHVDDFPGVLQSQPHPEQRADGITVRTNVRSY